MIGFQYDYTFQSECISEEVLSIHFEIPKKRQEIILSTSNHIVEKRRVWLCSVHDWTAGFHVKK